MCGEDVPSGLGCEDVSQPLSGPALLLQRHQPLNMG